MATRERMPFALAVSSMTTTYTSVRRPNGIVVCARAGTLPIWLYASDSCSAMRMRASVVAGLAVLNAYGLRVPNLGLALYELGDTDGDPVTVSRSGIEGCGEGGKDVVGSVGV